MDFELAGFIFHFNLDANGKVVSIVTPDLSPVFPATEIAFDPSVTVAIAKASVTTLLVALGLL